MKTIIIALLLSSFSGCAQNTNSVFVRDTVYLEGYIVGTEFQYFFLKDIKEKKVLRKSKNIKFLRKNGIPFKDPVDMSDRHHFEYNCEFSGELITYEDYPVLLVKAEFIYLEITSKSSTPPRLCLTFKCCLKKNPH